MTIIRVIDLETNGPTPDRDEFGVCEIGYTDVVATNTDLAGNGIDWIVRDGRSRLVNPGSPMTPETMAVHHIVDADLADADPWKPVMRSFVRQARKDGVIAFGAHSSSMEELWIHPDWWDGEEPLPWVCSYKSALRVWPDAPGHGNQVLRYANAYPDLDRAKAHPVHRAGPDSYVTAFHIAKLLNDGTALEQMIEWTKEPALTVRCYLGDWRNDGKGTPWPEVDTSMLMWILDKGFHDKPDIRFTAEYHLRKREEEDAAERELEDLNRQLEANGLATVNADGTDNPLVDPDQGVLL